MVLFYFLFFTGILTLVNSQYLTSPCPDVFDYERNNTATDRWYGNLHLRTKEDLSGTWIRVVMDRPALFLGNWFSEAASREGNTVFVIKNRGHPLKVGEVLNIRFFIKYNPNEPIPKLKTVLLNARDICAGQAASTSHDEGLFISKPEDQANGGGSRPSSVVPPSSQPSSNYDSSSIYNVDHVVPLPERGENHDSSSVYTPSQSTNNLSADKGNDNLPTDDYFPGDFALTHPSQRPSIQRPVPLVPSRGKPACGTVAAQASPLISHGTKTNKGQWPWHAALYHSQAGIQLMYTCGATLISELHVITAAHCVTKPHTNLPIPPESVIVYLGKHNLNTFGTEVQDREVSQIFIHPQYNYSVFFNDIAIIKLKTSVEFNNFVRPACLWGGDVNLEHIVDKPGTVVGWGFDENRKLSANLMQAQMPVVSLPTCLYSNREFFSQFTFEKTYCAGYRNGTSVCNGDSGGGMVFPRTQNGSTVWQIRGIVSVGVALQGKGICDPSHYIVFTDVAKYLDWIERVINV